MTRANLDKRPGDVAAMFDGVAERYDLLNDVLSLGQDRRWRRVVARAVGARPGRAGARPGRGHRHLVAGLHPAGARCVACDFSLGMLRVGARAARPRQPPANVRPAQPPRAGRFVAGDALRPAVRATSPSTR